jgi:hypothetical protein
MEGEAIQSGMRPRRLNVFQRLVRQWDLVHPYNASQVLRIRGAADPAAMNRAWREAITTSGLGLPRVMGRSYWYEPLNGDVARQEVARLPEGTSLEEYISGELNRPFDGAGEFPLRPFLLQEQGTHYAGIVYQHWVADSASIRMLLRDWFARLHDPATARTRPMAIARYGYWGLYGPHRARWSMHEQVLMFARNASRMRRVRRIRTTNPRDYTMRFTLHRVDDGVLERLLGVARRHGVTLNDLFLGAMADVCDRYLTPRENARRQDLALGTIVDMRGRSPFDMSNIFGLFLGFANVIFQRSELDDWSRMVRSIAMQTRAHKANDAAPASSLWMGAAVLAGRMLPQWKTSSFYRKHMPLAGGISNVNLNRTWAARYHPDPLLEYIRVSPTGPMVPLVFTPTTLGGQLHFGLTHRCAVITDAIAQQMAARFIECLHLLADGGDQLLAPLRA